ncbi:MAG: cytochrome c biogenesis CcdA family protein [Candidatus Bathyarchaeia archaeon]|jgi:cytochrome c biogenesis protein CcdA
MTSLLLLGYVIAAFVAGVIALAMPCCFSVLLPAYFAQSFKQKSRLVGMTALFSTGIATVMLPLAFGISFVGRALGTSHELIFVAGGLLMVLIGFWTLWGWGMLPKLDFPVNLSKVNAASVYTLGIFSGAATSCCAPVLAGVLILAALTANMLEGILVGFVYVVGMVFPLFVIALLWEKYEAVDVNPLEGKLITLKLFGREYSSHSSKLIAGVMFLMMGVVNIYVGWSGNMIPAPGASLIGDMQARLQTALLTTFTTLSIEPAILAVAIALLSFLVVTRLGSGKARRTVVAVKSNPNMQLSGANMEVKFENVTS